MNDVAKTMRDAPRIVRHAVEMGWVRFPPRDEVKEVRDAAEIAKLAEYDARRKDARRAAKAEWQRGYRQRHKAA